MQSLRRGTGSSITSRIRMWSPGISPVAESLNPMSNRELTLGKIQKWVVGSRNGTERELRLMSPREAMRITKGKI